jgi:hypothetical protein
MRTIKRVRLSPRNERSVDVPRPSSGPLGPLSRFRRDMYTTCQTVPPTRSSLDRTVHTGTGLGINPALESCRAKAVHFQCSPANFFSARGFVTTSVSRSQTATLEDDQRPQGTLENALPADDASFPPRRTAGKLSESEKEDLKILRTKCRQTRGFKLNTRFSEFSQLFGEETCCVVLSTPGQEDVKAMASAPKKVRSDYPSRYIF